MITYEEFLKEPISINQSYVMTREDYYKKFIPNGDPRQLYDQIYGTRNPTN